MIPNCLLRLKNRTQRTFLRWCVCALLITLWVGNFFPWMSVAAAASDAPIAVQSGIEYYESGSFSAAIEQWLEAYSDYENDRDFSAIATVSTNLARAYQQLGQTYKELAYWEKAITAIKSLPPALDHQIKLGHLLTDQAQAYSRLGQHRQAIAVLCNEEAQADRSSVNGGTLAETCQPGSALQIAIATSDPAGQVVALGSLGEAYRLISDSDKAFAFLEKGLETVGLLERPELESALLNSMGSIKITEANIRYRLAEETAERGDEREVSILKQEANEYTEAAIAYFKESYALSPSSPETQLRSLISLIPAYLRLELWSQASHYQQQATNRFNQMPDTQNKAFAAIKLAGFVEAIREKKEVSFTSEFPLDAETEEQVSSLLNQGLEIAYKVDSNRAESFALGRLGRLDERAGRYSAAFDKTQAARLAAEGDPTARDSRYLWAWQAGRIFRALGDLEDATNAYQDAVTLLEDIRSEILSASRELQFDFRDSVEPVYRQYAELSLKDVPTTVVVDSDGTQAFKKIDKTLNTLSSLQVAEIQSYFANDCVIAPADVRIDEAKGRGATAVFSTAILDSNLGHAEDKQLVVIVGLPDGSKKVVRQSIKEESFRELVDEYRLSMEEGRIESEVRYYDQQPSRLLYDWLIRPFETELDDGVETLVFVNDGILRSVPMAALHDGEHYLIEDYAIATSPSLTLTSPQAVDRPATLSALLMGVSEKPNVEARAFAPLEGVDQEISAVSQLLRNSKTLMNEEFSQAALRREIAERDYQILHMATHGTFGADPATNYLVTGAKNENNFNELLTIRQLDAFIRSTDNPNRPPIELLTLTACETAVESNRSTLGLAGVAVRAGVRSAIASLWSVSDEHTATLISNFYKNLQTPSISKAKALQEAQIAMIRAEDEVAQHPYRWAPFVLIGNWL